MQPLITETAYVGKIITLQKRHFQDGNTKRVYEIIHHPGGACTLPVFEDGNILLISQYRVAISEKTWELPAGLLEKEEDPLFCAQRELQEETGYSAKKITPFGKIWSSPGILDEKIYLFLAEQLYLNPLPCDEDEKIDKKIVSLETALQMIDDGRIMDAKTIILLLKYAMWRQK